MPHRKVWECVSASRAAAEQHGILEPGRHAVGFGVGQEPIPAALAQAGLTVLATDLDVTEEASTEWAATTQHMSDLRFLSLPDIVPDDVLERQVTTRYVDMNSVPEDLGRFDLVWSCCALEHLGSPEAGLEFIVRTLDLLEPGGVSVHTTELELTPRTETSRLRESRRLSEGRSRPTRGASPQPRLRDPDKLVRVDGHGRRSLGLAPALSQRRPGAPEARRLGLCLHVGRPPHPATGREFGTLLIGPLPGTEPTDEPNAFT